MLALLQTLHNVVTNYNLHNHNKLETTIEMNRNITKMNNG